MRIFSLFILLQFCLLDIYSQEIITNKTLSNPEISQEVSEKARLQAKKHYEAATKKSNKGDKQGSIIEYKEAISLNPFYIEACNDIAVAYQNLKDYDNALHYFNLALSIQPDYKLSKANKSIVLFLQGNEKMNIGNNQSAIPYYQQALSINPNNVEAYNNLAIVNMNLENFDLAIENLNMALKINPEYNLAKNNKALVYCNKGSKKINTGDYQGAINDYTEALNSNPNYLDAYTYIANAYVMKSADYKTAIIYLNKALELSPYNESLKEIKAIAYLRRGTKKMDSGDNQGAVSDFMDAIDTNPFCQEAYAKVATAFTNLGNKSLSEQYGNKALKMKDDIKKRNEAKIYYTDALKKYELQNYQEAITDFTKAISVYPEYFEVYNDRGTAYSRLNRNNKAIADYKKALEINPNYDLAQKNKEIVEQNKKEQLRSTLELITTCLGVVSNTANAISNLKNPDKNNSSLKQRDPNAYDDHTLDSFKAFNAYSAKQADKAVADAKKNNEYYYNYYTKEAQKERAEAERDLKESERYKELAEIGIKLGKDESFNIKYSIEALSSYKKHQRLAEEADESAEIFK